MKLKVSSQANERVTDPKPNGNEITAPREPMFVGDNRDDGKLKARTIA